MDEFEQSGLEKKTNDSRNSCYQNAIRFKEKENALIKNCKCGLFSLVFVMKLGEVRLRPFSRTTEDRQGHKGLTEFITM